MRAIAAVAALLTLAACGTVTGDAAGVSESTTSSTSPAPTSTTTTTTLPGLRESGIQFTELLTFDRIGEGTEAPVAILFHGGGWYGGDRSSTEPLAQMLADVGWVVINATYRTSAGGFPASVEDAVCATIAGRAVAAEAGGTGPLIVVGHSAGAHIASLVTLAGDQFPPVDCFFDGEWVAPDGFVGLAGPYKIQNLFGLLDDWMGVGQAEDPDLWAAAVPESYVDRHIPVPIRLIHGDADRVANISFSRLLRDELSAIDGRDVELIEIPGGAHSSMLAPLIDAQITVDAMDELAALAASR